MDRIYKVESIASRITVPPVMEILTSERVRLLRHTVFFFFWGGKSIYIIFLIEIYIFL